MTAPDVLTLLGPIGTDQGKFTCVRMREVPFEGWIQVRLVLGDGRAVLRVVTALFDVESRPQTIGARKLVMERPTATPSASLSSLANSNATTATTPGASTNTKTIPIPTSINGG